jgi:hypothetical protein
MSQPVGFINDHPIVCSNILWTCGFEMYVQDSNTHRTVRQEKFLTVIQRAVQFNNMGAPHNSGKPTSHFLVKRSQLYQELAASSRNSGVNIAESKLKMRYLF